MKFDPPLRDDQDLLLALHAENARSNAWVMFMHACTTQEKYGGVITVEQDAERADKMLAEYDKRGFFK